MMSNLAMNMTSPYQNPFLYNQMGNTLGPFNPLASMFMNPMIYHWFNPVINPMYNPFSAYPTGELNHMINQYTQNID